MDIDDLWVFDAADIQVFNRAISELILRKTLHTLGYPQQDFELTNEAWGDIDLEFSDVELDIEATKKTLAFIGFPVIVPDDDTLAKVIADYREFNVDIELPDIETLSPQGISRYRKRWLEILGEKHVKRWFPSLRIYTTKGRSVLRLTGDRDTWYGFYMQLPSLVENLTVWRQDVKVVFGDEPGHNPAA